MIKNQYVAFVLFVIAVLAFWNLLDFLYTTFLIGSAYHFEAGSDIALPVVVSVVVGYSLFMRKNSD